MKKTFGLILFISFCMSSVYAQVNSSVYNFLQLPVSSAINGLGGSALVMQDNDLSLGLSNPALLRSSMNRQAMLSNSFFFAGINHGCLGYAQYDKKSQTTFSGSLQYALYGKSIRTDEAGNIIGEFFSEDLALGMGAGRQIDKWHYGADMKVVYSSIANISSYGVSSDMGIAYMDTTHGYAVGLTVKNFGHQFKTYHQHDYEPLPLDVQLGFSKSFAHLPFTFQMVAHHLQQYDIRYDNPADHVVTTLIVDSSTVTKTKKYTVDKIARHLIVGGQIHIRALYIQLGYNHLRRSEMKTTERKGLTGFSVGAGIRIKRLQIGYSQAWYYLPSASNQITIATTIPDCKKPFTSITPSF